MMSNDRSVSSGGGLAGHRRNYSSENGASSKSSPDLLLSSPQMNSSPPSVYDDGGGGSSPITHSRFRRRLTYSPSSPRISWRRRRRSSDVPSSGSNHSSREVESSPWSRRHRPNPSATDQSPPGAARASSSSSSSSALSREQLEHDESEQLEEEGDQDDGSEMLVALSDDEMELFSTTSEPSPVILSDADDDDDDEVNVIQTFVNLASDDNDDDEDDAIEAQWQCPRCTLLNPIAASMCEACHYFNRAITGVHANGRQRSISATNDTIDRIGQLNSDALWGASVGWRRSTQQDGITDNTTTPSATLLNSSTLTSDWPHPSTNPPSWVRPTSNDRLMSRGSSRARDGATSSPSWARTLGTTWHHETATGRAQTSPDTPLRGGLALRGARGPTGAPTPTRDASLREGSPQSELSGAFDRAVSDFIRITGTNESSGLGNNYSSWLHRRQSTSDRNSNGGGRELSSILQQTAQRRAPDSRYVPRRRESFRVTDLPGTPSRTVTYPNATTDDDEATIAMDTFIRSLLHSTRHRHGVWHRRASTPTLGSPGMSYEHLLEMFGDGTENRGADPSLVAALPSSTINDAGKLSEDARQCSICLEDFESGDKRRILPCLHGFHEACVDRWLSSNGTCPVCKHSISG